MSWFYHSMPGFFIVLMSISLAIAAAIYQLWLVDVL